ncbi:Hypothetical protein PBC10988_28310 [Planctomycetales bacterium 10988]|nr:Hypothetical protein PBC10988_28310 [Planctomycetales bacterium 10988]
MRDSYNSFVRLRTRRRTPRAVRLGFTLVEMIVVIAVIGILAAISWGTLQRVQNSVMQRKTEYDLKKIHNAVMARWEEYQTRQVPLDALTIEWIANNCPSYTSWTSNPNLTRPPAYVVQRIRLDALRDLQRMEMPDKLGDVCYIPYFSQRGLTNQAGAPPGFVRPMGRPSVAREYVRTLVAKADERGMTISDYLELVKDENMSGEMLYLMLTSGNQRRSGRSGLESLTIGDTDGDGMPEFLDGWGRPFVFFRWPAGFVSDLQPIVERPDPDGTLDGMPSRDPVNDHDPLDPIFADFLQPGTANANDPGRGFRVVPLILSRGADVGLGIDPLTNNTTPNQINAANVSLIRQNIIDPYRKVASKNALTNRHMQPGGVITSNYEISLKNIYSHNL